MVEFNGHFDGTAITPDEQVEIPVNVPLRVTIEPLPDSSTTAVDWGRILEIASQCAIEGPEDLAENHDQYAHGKRNK